MSTITSNFEDSLGNIGTNGNLSRVLAFFASLFSGAPRAEVENEASDEGIIYGAFGL
jgi:hypothetical protein